MAWVANRPGTNGRDIPGILCLVPGFCALFLFLFFRCCCRPVAAAVRCRWKCPLRRRTPSSTTSNTSRTPTRCRGYGQWLAVSCVRAFSESQHAMGSRRRCRGVRPNSDGARRRGVSVVTDRHPRTWRNPAPKPNLLRIPSTNALPLPWWWLRFPIAWRNFLSYSASFLQGCCY